MEDKPQKHPGGRPKGTKNKPTVRSKIRDVMTEKQAKDLLNLAIKKAKEDDRDLLKFLLEQFYGRAAQSLDVQGNIGFSLTQAFNDTEDDE